MYVPALRWKRGEIGALKQLIKGGFSSNATPLLLIDNVRERQHAEHKQKIPKTPETYIDFIAREMLAILGDRRGFVDTALFDASQSERDGMELFFQNMTAGLSSLVPVVRLKDNVRRRKVSRERAVHVGACVRLSEAQFAKREELNRFLDDLEINPSRADLILDLGALESERYDWFSIADWIKRFGEMGNWRTIILLAGSYPKKIPSKPDEVLTFPRYEYDFYTKVCSEISVIGCVTPAFGDYGIMHPDAKPTSGSKSGGGGWPIIRYCSDKAWMVFKPKTLIDDLGLSTYFELTRRCAVQPIFMGDDFSEGDRYIGDRACGRSLGSGNSTTYVSADSNHHIAFVSAQLNSAQLSPKPIAADRLVIPRVNQPMGNSEDDFWD